MIVGTLSPAASRLASILRTATWRWISPLTASSPTSASSSASSSSSDFGGAPSLVGLLRRLGLRWLLRLDRRRRLGRLVGAVGDLRRRGRGRRPVAQAADHLGERVAHGVELLGHRTAGLGGDAQHLVVGQPLAGRAGQRWQVAGCRHRLGRGTYGAQLGRRGGRGVAHHPRRRGAQHRGRGAHLAERGRVRERLGVASQGEGRNRRRRTRPEAPATRGGVEEVLGAAVAAGLRRPVEVGTGRRLGDGRGDRLALGPGHVGVDAGGRGGLSQGREGSGEGRSLRRHPSLQVQGRARWWRRRGHTRARVERAA